MNIRSTLALLLAATASTGVHAQDYTESVLLERGDWSVNEFIFHGDSQSSTCDALTYSDDGIQLLTISGFDYDHDTLTVTVWDNSWEIGDRPVNFVIGTGTSNWAVDGHAYGTNISTNFESQTQSQRFMNDVAAGNRLTFATDSGSPLANFSLRGSSAAMSVLADCWARLQPSNAPSADPFANDAVADPFANDTKADPFSNETTADPFATSANAADGYGGFEAYIANMAANAFLLVYDQKDTTAEQIGRIPGDAEGIFVIWCKDYYGERWCDVRWEGQRGFVLGGNLQNVEGG
jgi:hypothetical protein